MVYVVTYMLENDGKTMVYRDDIKTEEEADRIAAEILISGRWTTQKFARNTGIYGSSYGSEAEMRGYIK